MENLQKSPKTFVVQNVIIHALKKVNGINIYQPKNILD